MYKTLNDVWGEWYVEPEYDEEEQTYIFESSGIFDTMLTQQEFDDIFGDLDITAVDLDTEYHGVHSGQKLASPVLLKMLGNNDELPEGNKRLLAGMILRSNYDRWVKLANTYLQEYDPIANYDMDETESRGEKTEYGKTDTRQDYLKQVTSGTDNITHGETIGTTDSHAQTQSFGEDEDERYTEKSFTDRKDTETKTVAGWNSANFSNADKNELQKFGTEKETQHGTETVSIAGGSSETHGGTDYRSMGSETDNTGKQVFTSSGDDQVTENRHLTRKGNIGVTTTQQMLEQERKLYLWDFIHEVVFPDIDKVLTLRIY